MPAASASAIAAHDAAVPARSLLDQGVPAAAIPDVGQVLWHPHTRHRGMAVESAGHRGLGPPVKLSRTPAGVRRRPPRPRTPPPQRRV